MNTQQQLPSQLKDYFGNEKNQVKNYETYRPKYPEEMIKIIKESVEKGENKGFLDIACGTGQLLFQLQNEFQISVGTDISEKQLSVVEETIKEKHLQSQVYSFKADCHQLPALLNQNNLPQKFDLVTVGQALHWFDVHPFLQMVGKDLLKPNGSFIILSYFCNGYEYQFEDAEISQRAKTYNGHFDDKICELYKFDYQEVLNGYPTYRFNEIYKDVKKVDQVVKTPATVDQFINFVKTFSAYNTYVELHSQKEGYVDPAEEMRSKIESDIQEYYTKKNNLPIPQQPIKIINTFFLRLLRQLI